LAAVRTQRRPGDRFTVVALARDPNLLPLARTFGADEGTTPDAALAAGDTFDVVIDTTGNPDALPTAVVLARREVHLKSTHGRSACGLRHLTEAVVDEIALGRFPDRPPELGSAPWDRLRTGPRARIAWLAAAPVPAWLRTRADVQVGDAAALAAHYREAHDGLPRADVAVADSTDTVDRALRPVAGREEALLRPRGDVLLAHAAGAPLPASPLLQAILQRDLRLSTSRCGDFRKALELLAADPDLARIGERLVTHRFAAADLALAFATAGGRGCIKAFVEHAPGARP
jgi:threonine dehydrogenase-like Zn-dependent dehydrogenase